MVRQKKMFLALIPSSIEELMIAGVAMAVGLLLVLLGNILFGSKKEGGGASACVCRRLWRRGAGDLHVSAFLAGVYGAALSSGVGILPRVCVLCFWSDARGGVCFLLKSDGAFVFRSSLARRMNQTPNQSSEPTR